MPLCRIGDIISIFIPPFHSHHDSSSSRPCCIQRTTTRIQEIIAVEVIVELVIVAVAKETAHTIIHTYLIVIKNVRKVRDSNIHSFKHKYVLAISAHGFALLAIVERSKCEFLCNYWLEILRSSFFFLFFHFTHNIIHRIRKGIRDS